VGFHRKLWPTIQRGVHPTRREEIVGRFGEAVSAAITLAYQTSENEVMQIPGDVQQEP
jgi:hypothetical protein